MDSELKYPEWQLPLQDAILDFRNKVTLHERETDIRERLEGLGISSDEREALIEHFQ